MSDRKSKSIFRAKTPVVNPLIAKLVKRVSIIRPKRLDFETTVVVSDAHVPFQNVDLHNSIRQFIVDTKPQGIIFPGDFADIFTLSAYVADSVHCLRSLTLDDEYESCNNELDKYDAVTKGMDKKFLYGNHEDRYFREVKKGDRGKYGKSLISPTVGLRLRERGYEVKEDWSQDFFKFGEHLEVIHGTYCNKYAAAKHLEEMQSSTVFGHSHRAQSYITGKRASYNIGCTCEIDSEGFWYMPRPTRSKWVNAFAEIQITPDGAFNVDTHLVYGGRFYAHGKKYSA